MRNDSDKKNLVIVEDGMQGLTRWVPTIIVFCVVGGFFALSWYAYHAGMESVRDEDLLVVEADKTPMKEKPADPGGMQFPNQDKTIFDTFGGSKPTAQNVERILPSPEEPLNKDMDTSETRTWINNKLIEKRREDGGAQAEAESKAAKAEKAVESKSSREVIPVSAPDDESETFVAAPAQVLDNAVKSDDGVKAAKEKAEKAAQEKAAREAEEKAAHEKAAMEKAEQEKAAREQAAQEKAERAKAEEKAALAKAAEAAEKAARPAASGNAAVQLGAYRSEDEAIAAWNKMHTKHKGLVDKSSTILRADLGSRGIYYRLRVTNLSAQAAKDLCRELTSAGQPCIVPAK